MNVIRFVIRAITTENFSGIGQQLIRQLHAEFCRIPPECYGIAFVSLRLQLWQQSIDHLVCIDTRTLQLGILDVHRNMSGGVISCLVKTPSDSDAANNVTVTVAGMYSSSSKCSNGF